MTRQSIYLGFGNRVRPACRNGTPLPTRRARTRAACAAIALGAADAPEALLAFVRAWLQHLPEIYPRGHVAARRAAVTDPEAAEVFHDRMIGGLKPLLPPILPPLPSNAALTPSAVGTGSQSPHSSSLYDSRGTTSPAPGLRFSIPTR